MNETVRSFYRTFESFIFKFFFMFWNLKRKWQTRLFDDRFRLRDNHDYIIAIVLIKIIYGLRDCRVDYCSNSFLGEFINFFYFYYIKKNNKRKSIKKKLTKKKQENDFKYSWAYLAWAYTPIQIDRVPASKLIKMCHIFSLFLIFNRPPHTHPISIWS